MRRNGVKEIVTLSKEGYRDDLWCSGESVKACYRVGVTYYPTGKVSAPCVDAWESGSRRSCRVRLCQGERLSKGVHRVEFRRVCKYFSFNGCFLLFGLKNK